MSIEGEKLRGPASTGALEIRAAVPGDLPRIWELLLGLARYERLTEFVTGSPERLGAHLFGDAAPRVECRVAEEGGALHGYALFFTGFSSFRAAPTLWLEDLYVTDSVRGRGVGRALLAAVAREAVRRGCPRVDWVVLDWNDPAVRFYERLGGGRSKGWDLFGVSGAALQSLAGEAGQRPAAG